MLIPKKNRLAILSYLFKEGVLVCNKDLALPKHMVLEVPNLHVVKLMQSLRSKNYVTEQYNWGYLYYRLTNEGIEALREQLHISGDTVPATLKKADKPQPPPSFGSNRYEREDGTRGGGRGRGRGRDRDEYRGAKKIDDDSAPNNFNPQYDGQPRRGGFRGRGRGRGGRGRGAPRGAPSGGDAPAPSSDAQ